MKPLEVVLHAHAYNVPELINQTRLWAQNITDNAALFPSCMAIVANVLLAAGELETADEAATDGGKTKTNQKNDKRKKLLDLLPLLAHQVEQDANGDESIVHLAGMEVKRKMSRTTAEFSVKQADGNGTVKIRAKAREKTVYKWQYTNDPSLASWIDAGVSHVSKKVLSNLSSGVYWFRVIFVDSEGEHNGDAFKFAVT